VLLLFRARLRVSGYRRLARLAGEASNGRA
jgi:hypothetical protein